MFCAIFQCKPYVKAMYALHTLSDAQVSYAFLLLFLITLLNVFLEQQVPLCQCCLAP